MKRENHIRGEMITNENRRSKTMREDHIRGERITNEKGTIHPDNRTCRREGRYIYLTVIKVGRSLRNANWVEQGPLDFLFPPHLFFFLSSPLSSILLLSPSFSFFFLPSFDIHHWIHILLDTLNLLSKIFFFSFLFPSLKPCAKTCKNITPLNFIILVPEPFIYLKAAIATIKKSF